MSGHLGADVTDYLKENADAAAELRPVLPGDSLALIVVARGHRDREYRTGA
ncbi:hypothetical protein AB4305_16215 [Nocardia sp. 2YAB30]|uniref:hypothetical protein n=1 Tax=unclassified Nocardia TaxID=2637762 RepID=UPI003F95B212